MTTVKLCGMRTLEHARAAVELGAEYVGFVLAPARRQVTPALVREITTALGPGRARYVGLFVNADPEDVRRVAAYAGLDAVQLCGAESPEQVRAVGLPAYKVVHVRPDADALADAERYAEVAETIVLDAYSAAAAGGTGRTFDWGQATAVARRYPVMLAGGLTPENVVKAVRTVAPMAVDVSSGIETDGTKDREKMRAFVSAAREVER